MTNPPTAPIAKPSAASLAVKAAAFKQCDDEERRLRVRPLEERLDHRVDVRHRRRVDGERARPAVTDPERAKALPRTPDDRRDGDQEHSSDPRSIDPGVPVHGPLNCD